MVEAAEQEPDSRDINDQRREFLEARATIIGATDSPKILGLSRYGTALSVYEDKTTVTEPGEMSLPAWLGLKLQNTVAELYTAKTGIRLRADNLTHRMKDYDFIGCHLDFRVLGDRKKLVECKTRAFMRGWGDEGTDKVPAEIWIQVQHEMMVARATSCDVAVLFGHHTFRVYTVERNDEFIGKLLETLIEFREKNWIPRIPPAPTGHPRDTEIVKAKNPDHDDSLKAATPEQIEIVNRYQRARMNAAQAKLAEAELKNRITDIIGDAAGITGTFGTITWKRSRDTQEVGWQNVAGSYRKMIEDLLGVLDRIKDDSPDDWEKVFQIRDNIDTVQSIYTIEKPGTRRINVQLTEEEEADAE
jgi:putative phage-type endonuclease